MRNAHVAALAAFGILAAGCDNGGSAVETRDRDAEAGAAVSVGAEDEASQARAGDAGEAERGTPVWSATRRYSAEDNARRAFERNGAAFDAADVEAYVRQAHAFISEPPAGTETARRSNGDTLYYHAPSNTFAVATAEGAPRTMFKPDDGGAYWAEQLEGLERTRSGD